MTESEAKTKWCPMVHTRYLGTLAAKGEEERAMKMSEGKDRLSKCIASDCAMWQATDNICPAQYPGGPKAKSKPAGYCGLAGRP